MSHYAGGTFAPAMTDKVFADYGSLISQLADGQLKEVLNKLLILVQSWWLLPESEATASIGHSSGRGIIVPLAEEYQKQLYDLIPWDSEFAMYGALFEAISSPSIRNMAFHLLWHAKELSLNREPITLDKL